MVVTAEARPAYIGKEGVTVGYTMYTGIMVSRKAHGDKELAVLFMSVYPNAFAQQFELPGREMSYEPDFIDSLDIELGINLRRIRHSTTTLGCYRVVAPDPRNPGFVRDDRGIFSALNGGCPIPYNFLERGLKSFDFSTILHSPDTSFTRPVMKTAALAMFHLQELIARGHHSYRPFYEEEILPPQSELAQDYQRYVATHPWRVQV